MTLSMKRPDVKWARVAMGVASYCNDLAMPPSWDACMDIGGKYAGTVSGSMNMMGNIGAYLCPKQVGTLFQSIESGSGNWNLVLWLFAGVNLACALSWLFVNPRRPVLE